MLAVVAYLTLDVRLNLCSLVSKLEGLNEQQLDGIAGQVWYLIGSPGACMRVSLYTLLSVLHPQVLVVFYRALLGYGRFYYSLFSFTEVWGCWTAPVMCSLTSTGLLPSWLLVP